MTRIELPLTDEQAQAVASAASSFGVKSWEMGVHVLKFKQQVAMYQAQEERN